MYRFAQIPLALFQYGCYLVPSGLSMSFASRDRVKRADLHLVANGPERRRLSDYYRNRGLFRVVVITREENDKLSGVEDENVYEAIVAARGDGFVKMSVHHLIQFLPRGERITVLSEVEISEGEYNELAK